jgi:signal transduction histidine kinase
VNYVHIVTTIKPPHRVMRGLTVLRDERSELQLIATGVIVAVSAATTRPLGWTGHGLLTAILLVACSVMLGLRHLPVRVLPAQAGVPALVLWAVLAAALVSSSQHGSGYLYAFYCAGHAGYRLESRPALMVAAAVSILTGGALLLHIGVGYHQLPWLVGAATGFAVFIGMASRSSAQALASALAAAASAERAARAEANEVVLAERGRIARDVHDVLAHSLAGINMQLELADALLDTGDVKRARQATQRAQSLVRESLTEAQRTVRALREDTLPLVDTVRAMLTSTGRPDTLVVDGTVREVDVKAAQNLVRIAQESLTNATKHAPGAAVLVTVTYEPNAVGLEVVNDPAPGAPNAGGSGMGLVGMQERVALLGGVHPGAEPDPARHRRRGADDVRRRGIDPGRTQRRCPWLPDQGLRPRRHRPRHPRRRGRSGRAGPRRPGTAGRRHADHRTTTRRRGRPGTGDVGPGRSHPA